MVDAGEELEHRIIPRRAGLGGLRLMWLMGSRVSGFLVRGSEDSGFGFQGLGSTGFEGVGVTGCQGFRIWEDWVLGS